MKNLYLLPVLMLSVSLMAEDKVSSQPALVVEKDGKTARLVLAEDVHMDLVLIPAGKAFLSAKKPLGKYEFPAKEVVISEPFFMGKFEVTQGQYHPLMGNTGNTPQGSQYPARGMEYKDVLAFLKKIKDDTQVEARLPTEAEWEYACRAGTKTKFHSGDDERELSKFAWYGKAYPNEVGKLSPNGFGLFDMHGNVWEWCSDPIVPGHVERHIRGGGFTSSADMCSNDNRSRGFLASPDKISGFRIVVPVPQKMP